METNAVNVLVVVALFASQFELASAETGVKLSMDLAHGEAQLRDGGGTAKTGRRESVFGASGSVLTGASECALPYATSCSH
jgi:hypothetical protein